MDEDPGGEDRAGAAPAAAPERPEPASAGASAASEVPAPAAISGAAAAAAAKPSRFHVEEMAKRGIEEAAKLGGVPPAKRARLSRAKLAPQDGHASFVEDVDDEMPLLEESTESVDMLAFKRTATHDR